MIYPNYRLGRMVSLMPLSWRKRVLIRYQTWSTIRRTGWVPDRVLSSHSVMSSRPLNMNFQKTLDVFKWDVWMHLCNQLMVVQLSDEPDRFIWNLTRSGIFIVKSMYEDSLNSLVHFPSKYLGKLKSPLKMIFYLLWFLNRKVLLIMANLIKRQWKGSKKCCFCDADESIEHLFLSCSLSKNCLPHCLQHL
jgi:hypothetical protein